MSSSFAKSSFGSKSGSKHPLRKFFMIAVLAGAALWGDYQYYTPDGAKDVVGQKVESVTHSEILGRAFGHKAPVATQQVGPAVSVQGGVQVQLPPAPGK